MVLETECPFVEKEEIYTYIHISISFRNASFPQLFRATVRNNQIDILLYKINRKTAALAGSRRTKLHSLTACYKIVTRREGFDFYLLQLELRGFRNCEEDGG